LFEFTVPGGIPQSPRPIAVSVIGHGLACLLLFALRFSSNVFSPAIASSSTQHVTVLAPLPALPQRQRMPRVEPARPLHAYLPAAPAARLEMTAAPTIPAPVLEASKPALPEIPRVAVMAAIKASAFEEVKAAAIAPAPKPVLKTSGFQSAESSATGPARGTVVTGGAFDTVSGAQGAPVRNAVASGGFSDVPPEVAVGGRRGSIASGSFGDTTVDRARHASTLEIKPVAFTPVEILSKPKPAYTVEARAKKIEGEVLLEMQFSASGEARVLRVVRGLGHGLDETALTAARGIQFRPATRDGGAVDSAAIVHIVFQIAN
jgi:TonB family protein